MPREGRRSTICPMEMEKMRVMIAGANKKALESLAVYFSDRGYESEITSNGLECMAGLRDFAPDLLVMEFDILWGGCDGVMEAMNDEPQLNDIPVILFTQTYTQPALEAYPRIIARLTHPIHSHRLTRLGKLLNEMELSPSVETLNPK